MLSNKVHIKQDEASGIALDQVDLQIISLLAIGKDNKEISIGLKTPLSTIQRGTKNILRSGIINPGIEPFFKRLGIKKGLLHVYLRNGGIKDSTLKWTAYYLHQLMLVIRMSLPIMFMSIVNNWSIRFRKLNTC
jgi:hypothetical protein